MTDTSHEDVEPLHYFVDEAGTPTLFGRRREVLVGKEGCSTYFLLGKVAVDDPARVDQALETLRRELLADPYFKNAPSMQPSQGKTALAFHAKDDKAEVRYEVFKLLRRQAISFYAVVRDKRQVLAEVQERNRSDNRYRYNENELYDGLVAKLFEGRFYQSDRFEIWFAKRGTKPRTEALNAAIEKAKEAFKSLYGFPTTAIVQIRPTTPKETVCLQVVDYYLWALQRFFEQGEDQYLEIIWPHTKLVHDIDDRRENEFGVCYSPAKPLTLGVRSASTRKKKGRRI
jgi:hypothetical protein